jgi:hypothetical protein
MTMLKTHFYKAKIEWTGNNGTGTDDYRSYERSHTNYNESASNPPF